MEHYAAAYGANMFTVRVTALEAFLSPAKRWLRRGHGGHAGPFLLDLLPEKMPVYSLYKGDGKGGNDRGLTKKSITFFKKMKCNCTDASGREDQANKGHNLSLRPAKRQGSFCCSTLHALLP